MHELIYQKYVVTNARDKNSGHPQIEYPVAWLRGGQNWGIDFHMNWECISRPFLMEPGDMVHDVDQILCFMGGDATDLFDFGAEVELSLGQERKNTSSPLQP